MKKLLSALSVLVLVGLFSVSCTSEPESPPANFADRPYVAFSLFKYSDYSDQVCQLDADKDKKINLKDLIGANDEATAGMLYGCYKGTVISVFDDEDGSKKDDWVKIEVKKDLTGDLFRVGIPTFEKSASYSDGAVVVTFYSENTSWIGGSQLDGKISRVEINVP